MTRTLALSFLLLTGCLRGSADREVHEPGTHPARDESCTDSCVLTCQETQRLQCENCYDNCARVGSCDVCSRNCYAYSCTDYCSGRNECHAYDYEFWFEQPDPEVGRACRAYMDHARSCGATVDGDPCATFERVEHSGVVATYECLTAQPCGAPAGACPEPAPIGLAESLCAELETRCPDGACNPDFRAAIENAEGWLRPDVVAAATSCIELQDRSCADYARCVEAFAEAVLTW